MTFRFIGAHAGNRFLVSSEQTLPMRPWTYLDPCKPTHLFFSFPFFFLFLFFFGQNIVSVRTLMSTWSNRPGWLEHTNCTKNQAIGRNFSDPWHNKQSFTSVTLSRPLESIGMNLQLPFKRFIRLSVAVIRKWCLALSSCWWAYLTSTPIRDKRDCSQNGCFQKDPFWNLCIYPKSALNQKRLVACEKQL